MIYLLHNYFKLPLTKAVPLGFGFYIALGIGLASL